MQEDAENDDQEAFEFVKQRLKQLYEKPDIVFLTTISDLYAEKLKENYFLHWFQKKTSKPLLMLYIINLFSSKVTHVCEIMTWFTNYDIIDLHMMSRGIFQSKMFKSG